MASCNSYSEIPVFSIPRHNMQTTKGVFFTRSFTFTDLFLTTITVQLLNLRKRKRKGK